MMALRARALQTVITFGLVLAASACVAGTTVTVGGETGSLTGRLVGGVTAGPDHYECTWLVTENGERIDVMYVNGWELREDPIRLVDPSGNVVATVGALIRVTGPIAGAGESLCSASIPFVAETVEVLSMPTNTAGPT